MAVCTLVACDSVNQALTCRSTSDSLVLAANKTASGITGVSGASGETVTARTSAHGTRYVQVPLVEALYPRSSNTGTDGLTVTRLLVRSSSRSPDVSISERLAIVASDVLLDLELS